MVKSKLNENLFYPENKNMELIDVGKDAIVYEIPLYNQVISIIIGNTQYHKDSEIIYFPVYLYNEKSDKNNFEKIGVYESNEN